MKKRRRTGKIGRVFFGILCALALLVAILILGIYCFAANHVDAQMDEHLFASAGQSSITRLYYNAGQESGLPSLSIMNGYYPAEVPGQALFGKTLCSRISLEEAPGALAEAFIAIEDRRFFKHNGVDLLRTAKAAFNHIFRTEDRFGGSTITQQLIKNIGGENEVTVFRKAKEILRALRLEQQHSKEEILEAYLNVIPMGRGCIGVGMAAKIYYGKEISELSVGECALLAAITNSPATYDPIRHPEAAKSRRDLVLDCMLREGFLTEEETKVAKQEPLPEKTYAVRDSAIVSWYTETVIADLIRDLSEKYGYTRQAASELVLNGGLSVYTLQDPQIQKHLEEYFSQKIQGDASRHYAMAITDAQTGDLLGIVGDNGVKKQNRILNLATEMLRPPGSALKPLSVFAPALEEGAASSLSVFDDIPISFGKDPKRPLPWPRNSPNVYHGLLPLCDAVAYSKNTVAVQLYEKLGAEKIYRYLTHRFGLSGILRQKKTEAGSVVTDLAASPLALGQLTEGVSVREITAAYGAFLAEGILHKCRSYALVLDRNGKVLLENLPEQKQILRGGVANSVTQLLSGVVEYGTAKDIGLKKELDVAGKTGTTSGNKDRWFVGYTPYYCGGVWCGDPKGETPVQGGAAPSKVWDEVMTLIHGPILQNPEGALRHFSLKDLTQCTVCRDSGLLPSDSCALDPRGDRHITLLVEKGSVPTEHCKRHVTALYDFSLGGVLPEDFVYEDEEIQRVALLDISWRDFPIQVKIKDAEYVWRDPGSTPYGTWWGVPFFVNTILPGRFVGITDHAGGRQFNAAAYERIYPPLTGPEEEKEEESPPPSSEIPGEDGARIRLPELPQSFSRWRRPSGGAFFQPGRGLLFFPPRYQRECPIDFASLVSPRRGFFLAKGG